MSNETNNVINNVAQNLECIAKSSELAAEDYILQLEDCAPLLASLSNVAKILEYNKTSQSHDLIILDWLLNIPKESGLIDKSTNINPINPIIDVPSDLQTKPCDFHNVTPNKITNSQKQTLKTCIEYSNYLYDCDNSKYKELVDIAKNLGYEFNE